MEKANGAGNKPRKPSRRRDFRANSLQISEDDASNLVGSIVEKGISENPQRRSLAPPPPPRPTVLPFPVARHRSHGPRWAPMSADNTGGGYDDEDDAEDEDLMELETVATLANPVKRKEKKGLDLSRWRELIGNDTTSILQNKDKHLCIRSNDQKKTMNVAENSENIRSSVTTGNGALPQMISSGRNEFSQDVTMNEVEYAASEKVSSNVTAETTKEIMGEMEVGLLDFSKGQRQVDMEKQGTSTSHMFSADTSTTGNEEESTSLESQIDIENRAHLERMSTDEIAEARAEILEKMNPAVIEALRRRGQYKLKNQKDSSSVRAAKGDAGLPCDGQKLLKDPNAGMPFNGDISHKMTTKTSALTNGGLNIKPMQNLTSGSRSLWDIWSGRVEAVRELRFSLDGNVVDNDLARVPTGSKSTHSGYTTGNVSERDFLRTEGDPAAAGYTIKEAIALTRSVIPGQRALALHLLASVLGKSLLNICQNQIGHNVKSSPNNSIHWGAVWAYALGPEPELALSLRMSLDDNHNSVVLASAKVIQCILSCDINESYFDISESVATYPKGIYTAPVFRRRPEIHDGFLQGGVWKYNTKPSNIFPFGEDNVGDSTEGEHTIQDDMVVAGQDFVAGLIRMGVLPRLRYLLETDPSATLEDFIMSILIAIARHSPTSSDAIMKCERLVQVVVDRFTMKAPTEVHPSKIKSVTLFKVLARSEKKNCIDFIKNGIFRSSTWHLHQCKFSLDQWVKLGRENCKLSSAIIVEQLRFWKVCIQYGYCISYFPDAFPALCMWLHVPTVEKLIENNVLSEFAAITGEMFLVLEALSRTLPNLYSNKHLMNQMSDVVVEDMETWCWPHVGPMVDLAIKWIATMSNPFMSKILNGQRGNEPMNSLMRIISAVMLMLSGVLDRVIPEDTNGLPGDHVPWLPDWVPKIGLEIIKNGFLSSSRKNGTEHRKDPSQVSSFIEYLCSLRRQGEGETSISSVCCLHGLVKVVVSTDKLIELAKSKAHAPSSEGQSTSREGIILADGVLRFSIIELRRIFDTFTDLVASEWKLMPSIEMFGRGGPAPGVGVGWGAVNGGFWSKNTLLAQTDAGILIFLLGIFRVEFPKNLPTDEETTFTMRRIISALSLCLTLGPRDVSIVEKSLEFLLQVPVLKFFDLCIRHFTSLNKGFKSFMWEYKDEDFQLFSLTLASHFRNRWLSVKKKKAAIDKSKCVGQNMAKGGYPLETIHEDLETSNKTCQDNPCTTVTVEWAHQRLPLPMHWYLSPISTTNIINQGQDPNDSIKVSKAGLFLILGIEVMASFLPTEIQSPVQSVPLTWKLHSLSVCLLLGMGVLEEEKTRDVYKTLQEVYGKLLDELWQNRSKDLILEANEKFSAENGVKKRVEFLRFQSEIHESYSTFMETLVEQFAAVSYGDLIYGRQISIYLHRCVEAPVRLAAWSTLSNARVLELLPPLENCLGKAEGYIEPAEDDERILEAYVKSWVSGALDRAATRRSVAFTLVLHHLTSFVFSDSTGELLSLRNKLATSLLRDYIRNKKHEGMMLDFIQYQKSGELQDSSIHLTEVEKRFKLLAEACGGNPTVLCDLEQLRLSFQKNTRSS